MTVCLSICTPMVTPLLVSGCNLEPDIEQFQVLEAESASGDDPLEYAVPLAHAQTYAGAADWARISG